MKFKLPLDLHGGCSNFQIPLKFTNPSHSSPPFPTPLLNGLSAHTLTQIYLLLGVVHCPIVCIFISLAELRSYSWRFKWTRLVNIPEEEWRNLDLKMYHTAVNRNPSAFYVPSMCLNACLWVEFPDEWNLLFLPQFCI